MCVLGVICLLCEIGGHLHSKYLFAFYAAVDIISVILIHVNIMILVIHVFICIP